MSPGAKTPVVEAFDGRSALSARSQAHTWAEPRHDQRLLAWRRSEVEQLRAWGPREGQVPGVGSRGQVESHCSVSAIEASWEVSESLGTTRHIPAEAVRAACVQGWDDLILVRGRADF